MDRRGTFAGRAGLRQAASTAQAAGRRALDALLPPRCLVCGGIVPDAGAMCGPCWAGMSFIEAPYCDRCGLPFEVDAGPASICGACSARPPPYGLARAVLRYDDASRPLILSFKNGDRMQAARHLGRWMARIGQDVLAGADVVAPTPLHWRRLVSRRYNQAAELARAIAHEAGVAHCADLLKRTRPTPIQGGLNARARRLNVRGAFAVTARHQENLAGASVVLVDDVFTTGATVEACTKTLLRAGAARVDILVLARVVRGAHLD